MTDEDKGLLGKFGWTVECESPLEIRHKDGAFVSGVQAVDAVLEQCRKDVMESGATRSVPTFHWFPKPAITDGMRLDDPMCRKILGEWLEKMARDGYACVFFDPYGDCLFRKDL